MVTEADASRTPGITQQRTLRRGRALWADSRSLNVPSRSASRDVFCDVAIVGAGISGALVARSLVARGRSVALLDRRDLLDGSTVASTALLQFEIDLPLTQLGDRIGLRKAERAWRRSVLAVRTLRTIVAREHIRCGFEPRNSLYLAGNEHGSRALRREVLARARAGVPGHFVTQAELRERYGIDRTGAIESEGNATADPAQLTAALLRRVVKRGARVYHHAEVQEISAGASGVVLGLGNGRYVIAEHAIFCTGYELLAQVPLDGHIVKSTWAVATDPVDDLPPWLRSTVVWEASDPYLYLRTTPDGRIVAGGEDETSSTRFLDASVLAKKTQRILGSVERLLPALTLRASHQWAGAFGESPTGLPIIDRILGLPRCYNVTGFGGNGITHSVIAAEVIANAIDGRHDADADLFRAPQ